MEKPIATQAVSIRLAEKNKSYIDHLSKTTKQSRSFLINKAVEIYINNRIAYLKELDEAIAEVSSGHIYASEQMHTWMKSWGTKKELPAPTITSKI